MKAKSRKRLLISSVAMLLVAMLALGTATFAWFSTTNQATASSLTAKTNKSSNILLNEYKTDNSGFAHDWSQTLTFTENTATAGTNGTLEMLPVTTKNFTTWNQVKAEEYNQGFNKTNTYSAVENIKSSGQYAKYTTLYIMNTGDTTNANINTTVSYADNSNTLGRDYIRVALVPIAADTNGTSAVGSRIIFGSNNDRSNEDAGWTAANQTANSIVGTTPHPLGEVQSLGSLTKGAVYGYDVYVYFEGTDFDCKDAFAGGNFTVSFTVAKAA